MQLNLREAERRIEEARRTGAEGLDLGDLALSELPASLGDLPQLKTLCLGKERLTEAGKLEYAHERTSPTFTNLQPLARLQALQSLNVAFCRGITHLQPLAGLQALQSLDLRDTGVRVLQPLAGLQALQTLNLSHCKGVTNLQPLAKLLALRAFT